MSSTEQLKQINKNHDSGQSTQMVIYLDLSNNMTNVMIIPNYFKQAMILNDRIIDEEIIERLLL